MQKITLMGFMGKDVEQKFTKNGVTLHTFSFAVNTIKDKPPTWYSMVIWPKRLEQFEKMIPYLKKGKMLIIGGDLHPPEIYVGNDGQSRLSLRVEPYFINFVSTGKDNEKSNQTNSTNQNVAYSSDDVPF